MDALKHALKHAPEISDRPRIRAAEMAHDRGDNERAAHWLDEETRELSLELAVLVSPPDTAPVTEITEKMREYARMIAAIAFLRSWWVRP